MTRQQLFTVCFFGVLLLLVYQIGLIFRPFVMPVLWAVILAHLTYPLHLRMTRWLGRRKALSAGFLTTTIMALGVLPIIMLGVMLVREAGAAYTAVELWIESGGVKRLPEDLARLPPAFAKDGTVTAGNSSGINDGAAAVLLADDETARRLGLKPLAAVGPSATAGVDPAYMGLGPVPATHKALAHAGIRLEDVDIMEINEAFAVQVLACLREFAIDSTSVNVNGGAIALGHPLGCSGARLVTTLVHEMIRRRAYRGLATLCVGVGQGVTTILEGVE